MKKNCPQRCDFCYGEAPLTSDTLTEARTMLIARLHPVPTAEPLEVVTTATPPAANTKIKMVPRGKVVGFRCGTKSTRSPPKIRSAHQCWRNHYCG